MVRDEERLPRYRAGRAPCHSPAQYGRSFNRRGSCIRSAPIAPRIAVLHHEVGNDAVDLETVEEPFLASAMKLRAVCGRRAPRQFICAVSTKACGDEIRRGQLRIVVRDDWGPGAGLIAASLVAVVFPGIAALTRIAQSLSVSAVLMAVASAGPWWRGLQDRATRHVGGVGLAAVRLAQEQPAVWRQECRGPAAAERTTKSDLQPLVARPASGAWA